MAPPPGRLLAARRCLITGASRGIGRAVAEAFAAQGARLFLTATREEHLDEVLATVRARGAEARTVALDLSDPRSVEHAAHAALRALGAVDVLVNSAALFGGTGALCDYPPDRLEEVLRVNLLGSLRLVHAVGAGLTRGAVVINVTSGAAGQPGSAAYGLSKAALDAATRMLRTELAPSGITCVAIDPGATRTRMRAEACPGEDPLEVPPPEERVAPFVAAAAGAPSGWLVRPGRSDVRQLMRRAGGRLVPRARRRASAGGG